MGVHVLTIARDGRRRTNGEDLSWRADAGADRRDASGDRRAHAIGRQHLVEVRENAPSRLFYERMGGRYLRDRDIERVIEGATVMESGYAWDDLRSLALNV